MYSKLSHGRAKKWLLLSGLLTSMSSVAAESDVKNDSVDSNQLLLRSTEFSAQPANCIALRHGRTCYANVSLHWVSATKQDYCIYIKQGESNSAQLQSLKCWKSSRGAQVIFNFESNQKIEFHLVSSKDKKIIAKTAVEVSWVHKASPRKRRWRIF